jgi:CubicO group peptidase (beta-lactamase class C family)
VAFWPSTPTSPRSSPELRDLDILTGLDARGQPTYIKDQNKFTLRQLLTHSSGLSYHMFNPTIQQWRASQGQLIPPSTTIRGPYLGPLLYEPGTGWEYSPAIGFVGLMVERVSDARNLQTYMERGIWSSLRIAEVTFSPQEQDDLKAQMPVMSLRDETGGKAVLRRRIVQEPPTDAMGWGAGSTRHRRGT